MSMRDAEQEEFGNKNVCTSMAGLLRCGDEDSDTALIERQRER
jgi:hypothetical protein